jgi:hypothetical protein
VYLGLLSASHFVKTFLFYVLWDLKWILFYRGTASIIRKVTGW